MKIPPTILTKTAGVFIMAVCIIVLISQGFNVPVLKTILPGFVTMKFNTALCLVLCAAALLLLNQKNISKTAKRAAFIFSVFVLLIASLTLSEYIFNWNAGIDTFFFKDHNSPVLNRQPGRMPVATAILLLLFSIVLLLLHKRRYQLLLQIILITGMTFLGLLFLFSLTGISADKTSSFVQNTILQSRFIFLLLYIAAFFSYPLSHLKFSFQKKITGYFVMVSLILAIVFLAFNRTNRQKIITSKLVDHTHEVIQQAEQIRTEVAEMQNAVRGFFITGDESYLPPFTGSIMLVKDHINRLQKLTAENPLQQRRIDSLKNLMTTFISSRNEQIRLRRATKFDEERIKRTLKEGKEMIDRVRTSIIAIQQEENKLLAIHKSANERTIQGSWKVITLFEVISGLMLLSAFIIIYKNTRRRNKLENEIKQNNIFLETILENIPSMIFVKEPLEHRFIQVNTQTEKIFGLSREEILGKTDYDLFPKEKAAAYLVTEKEVFASGHTLEIPAQLISTANGDRWLRRNKIPVYDKNKQPLYLIVISEDITEKKKAEEQLKEYKYFFDNSNDLCLIANEYGYFETITPKVEEVLGYKDKEILKIPFIEFIHPDDIPSTLLIYDGLKAGATVINFVNRYRKKDGSYLWFDWNASPNSTTGKLYCIARDITERKILEDKLKLFNQELEQKVVDRTRELSHKAEELKASNTELERFAYIASHDLQEPLRMVSSFMSLLEEGLGEELDETNKKYLDFAVDGAERMKKLIQDLLLYSRVGTNKEEFSPTDLNELMAYTIRVLEEDITKNRAVITVNPMPVITANKTLLTQLFVNLVNNALKYHGDKEPIIEVGYTEEQGQYIFYVKDNGIGMDPKFFEKIFIIFQRLHSKTEYSGTGIGLAICKKIAETHKGKIWVESEAGKGSTFYFSISKHLI